MSNSRNSNDSMNNTNNNKCYLSDEELEKLIIQTEAEPILCPPKGFQHEIIAIVRQRKRKRKNLQLFSYSIKVFAATAATLGILFMVPANIRPETGSDFGQMPKEQTDAGAEAPEQEDFARQINRRLNEYCNRLNGRLDQLVRMEVHFNEKEEK